MSEKLKTPWPTKAVMQQIYEQHLWGGKDHDFYSGEGSHNPEITTIYTKNVSAFLESNNNSLTVLDLGCGDFNIGQHIFQFTKMYIGVDIVEELIDRNRIRFKFENLKFLCLDISKDELPNADCVILRQVLQHLSNTEIKQIVNKLSNYKHVILTEHLPATKFTPNKDKIASLGIRLKQNSGVDILVAPFNLKVKSKKVLNEFVLKDNKGIIQTLLLSL